MKTLYVTDLDGTLLNDERLVTEKSASLINDAIKYGAYFSVATARTPVTVSELLSEIKTNMPYVVMTGSALWNPNDNTYSEVKSLSMKKASCITEIFTRNNVPALVYCLYNNEIHLYRLLDSDYSDKEKEFVDCKRNKKNKVIHIDENGYSEIPEKWNTLIFFLSIQPQESIDKVREELNQISDIDILEYKDSDFPGLVFLEIRKSGVSKESAISYLKEKYGFDRVIVFGDNKNDIPMFKIADLGVAVDNAIPELKDIADVIIGNNNEDSVARMIHLYNSLVNFD